MPSPLATAVVTTVTQAEETAPNIQDVLDKKPVYGSPRYRIHVDGQAIRYNTLYGYGDPTVVVHDAKYPGRIFRCHAIDILGESHMKFSDLSFKDGYGTTMWIETDAEVRLIDSGGIKSVSDRAESYPASDLKRRGC